MYANGDARALPQTQFILTEDEYLEFERNADVRHEYLDGHLFLMAGESDEQADISMNLAVLIGGQLIRHALPGQDEGHQGA